MTRRKVEISDEIPLKSDKNPDEISNEPDGVAKLPKMTDEEMISGFVEEAKERLEALIDKNPSIAMPDDEEIRRMTVLRFKRGLSTKEISRLLHRDMRVVTTVTKPIPRRLDPSYPIQDWERELVENSASATSKEAEKATSDQLEVQRAALKMLYGRKTFSQTSQTQLMVPVSLSSETVARLYSLALMDGYSDVDLWINETLIPWYRIVATIKRDFNIPQEHGSPKEFYDFFNMIIGENILFRRVFSQIQEVTKAIPHPVQVVVGK
jgi:hypothetical protein